MDKMMRLLFSSLFIIGAALLLVACGDSGNSGGGDLKLVAGTEATYAPMEYIDSSGEIVGIDIDIVNAIAEEIGAEVEFNNIGWDPLFPAVKNGEIDFAVSSITITEKRKEDYDFTEPYYIANQLILVPEDSTIEKFADLEGKKVAVQISTTGHEKVKELLGETNEDIIAPDNLPLAIGEMINGNAEAVVADNGAVNEYLTNNPDVNLKTIEDDSFEKEYYGLMVKKGNTELLDKLNEGIQKIKDNGKLKEITGFDVD